MKTQKKTFEPPLLKVVDVKVEKGFAASGGNVRTSDFTDGGEVGGSSGPSDGGIWKWLDNQDRQSNDNF